MERFNDPVEAAAPILLKVLRSRAFKLYGALLAVVLGAIALTKLGLL